MKIKDDILKDYLGIMGQPPNTNTITITNTNTKILTVMLNLYILPLVFKPLGFTHLELYLL